MKKRTIENSGCRVHSRIYVVWVVLEIPICDQEMLVCHVSWFHALSRLSEALLGPQLHSFTCVMLLHPVQTFCTPQLHA